MLVQFMNDLFRFGHFRPC